MPSIKLKTVIIVASSLALCACGTTNNRDTSYNASTPANASNYANYGVIQSIDLVRQDSTSNNGVGLGTVAGAVIGGIAGHQVGDGRGKDAATVIGAVGGAYAGHKIENNQKQQIDQYQFTIRMNNGSFQTFTQNTAADFRVGDRVQIDGGVLRRY